MTEDELHKLEQRLLGKPFDAALRCEYGERLLDMQRIADARAQYEIVAGANADFAPAQVGLARCELQAGDVTAALQRYRRASRLPDFTIDLNLEKLAAQAQQSTPQLGVARGTGEKVTQLHAHKQTKIGFSDIGGMAALKKVLRLQIIEPFRNPGLFQRFRKSAGGGVLLYGPPGCGKTMIARAVSSECNAEFVSVGISDVLNMWIGESEKNLAAVFEQARERRPCVLFFDELDALAYSRSKSSSSAARTIVNEFLAQLDGFQNSNENVLILAATNMPWDVDSAMKRPGRFSRQVFVPPPDTPAREQILRMKTADIPVTDIDYQTLAARTEYFSGADMDGLIDLAKEEVLAEVIDGGKERPLETRDFLEALENMTPSTADWLKTARNLVKFSGADSSYKEVEKYLKSVKRF